MQSGYPLATWRLLHSPPADGATNMAVDEAILWAVAAGVARPTLRLYAWQPGCLSLGRAQPVGDVKIEALQTAGFDLVRRPTGGRAILHIDELTYSIAAPEAELRVSGDVVESYRRLSAGLLRGLELLGVKNLAADRRVERRLASGPVCFEVPSDYEITVGGRKLVGSAQVRSRGAVLQHGALPLEGDIARICPFLAVESNPEHVRARATTLAEALGRMVSWEEAARALGEGFAQALNLHLEPGQLTTEELAWMEQLRAEKYASETWTFLV
ncbi:MAG: lipoate--protein ligase family protein [Anaerolineae bacterium]|nr:lipoate--protein ligase family protein [Anaerolineae bacterium]